MKAASFHSNLCLGVSYDREIPEEGMYFIVTSLIQDRNRVLFECQGSPIAWHLYTINPERVNLSP